VLLEVSDQGIGIAPEHQARVFERFQRAVPAQHFGGLGLGLYVARQIVEAHGGTIDVASEAGAGATFTVRLPKDPPPPRPVQEVGEADPAVH
jgi:signal transduction histidine kinase